MRSSTLQFLVAGALIVAWVWMLGRPVLTGLFRRSRRDSVGHFRYQQAVLGRPMDQDELPHQSILSTIVRPFRDWRHQPLERRRLQVMLGFAFSTFGSMLLAIAFRGLAVRLFLVMLASFVVHILYAAYVGSAQLRAERTVVQRRLAARRDALVVQPHEAVQRRDGVEAVEPADASGTRYGVRDRAESEPIFADDQDDLFESTDGFGSGEFEDDFFEPIPELQFAPLGLRDDEPLGPAAEVVEEPEYIEELGYIEEPEYVQDVEEGDWDEDGLEEEYPVETEWDDLDYEEHTVAATAEATDHQPILEQPENEPGETEDESGQIAFTTPPQPRTRPKRQKARPIYIESQLDEDSEQRRVVND